MQILYWPFRRPRRSSFGGQVYSPPLLQRSSTAITRIDTLVDSFVRDEEEEIMEVQEGEVMEFEEGGTPTVYYLNVDQFIQDNDQEVLNHQNGIATSMSHTNGDPSTSTSSQGGIQLIQQNGLPEGITIYQGDQSDNNESSITFHSSTTCTTITNGPQGNKRKGIDEDLEDNYEDGGMDICQNDVYMNGDIDECSNSSSVLSSNSIVKKRPKLVINLHEERRGYEIGSQLSSSEDEEEGEEDEEPCKSDKRKSEFTKLSHAIPYAEDSILRSIDREEIPEQLLPSLENSIEWNRGHIIAKIQDFRRFNYNGPSSSSRFNNHNNFIMGMGNGTSHYANSRFAKLNNQSQLVAKRPPPTPPQPVLREVVLRPTTQSILTDFDRLIDKSIKDRQKWKRSQNNINKDHKEEEDDQDEDTNCIGETRDVSSSSSCSSSSDSDSDVDELEVDLPLSLSEQSDELSYNERLELEKHFVNESSSSLCLDPSPLVGLIANRAQFERLKWKERKPKKALKAYNSNHHEESENSPNASLLAFDRFVRGVKDRVGSVRDPEPFKLPAMPCVDYPKLEPPRNLAEIIKIGQKPPAATLRAIQWENPSFKKIEEYVLETERRKRPHTTKLTIFQRIGIDSYFGELEMESFVDGPLLHKSMNDNGNGKVDPAMAATKCQFELGSFRSVELYVKQFSDIFTEDGRRPCKVSVLKPGMTHPHVFCTNSYKSPVQPGAPGAPSASSIAVGSSLGAAVLGHAATAAALNSRIIGNITPTIPVTISQPPIQIVHPQPRTIQLHSVSGAAASSTIISESGQTGQVHVYANGSQSQQQNTVNFNLNVNAGTGITPQQHQILTRPQIVSVNLQSNQTVPPLGPPLRPTLAHQQLIQQKILKMKQQHQMQQQQLKQMQNSQSNPALTRLLLQSMQQNHSGSKPITVAVQPQPQTANSLKNNRQLSDVLQQHQQQQIAVNPSTLMISSPVVSGAQTSQASSLNVNVNPASNLNLNLNAITLDNLLSGSSPVGNMGGTNLISAGNTNHLTHRTASNGTGTQGNMTGAVNILRVNSTANGGGISTGAQSLQRQLTMNNVSAGNVQILQTSQPQQRIFINANSGQQIGSVTLAGNNSGEVEELTVPDLNSLLAAGNGSTVQINGGQTQTIMTNHHQNGGLAQIATQTPTVDTHNLNLNLNVNLNSGTTIVGDSSHSQLQTSTQGHTPFLLFISPLRSVPVPIVTSTGVSRQQVSTLSAGTTVLPSPSPSPPTLSLNLGAVQQSIQQQQASIDSIVTSLASTSNVITVPTRTNNNGPLNNHNNNVVSSQNVSSSGEVIDGVDSIFNAISEAMGPELSHKLDGLSNNTVMIGNTPYSVSVSSSGQTGRRSQVSPAVISNSQSSDAIGIKKENGSTSVITLSDLLSSPTSSTNSPGISSLILNTSGVQGGHSPSIMVSSPQSSVSSTSSSSVISSTPRLSALLAGTPSADSNGSLGGSRISSGSPLSSPSSLSDSSSGGTLLDRLTANLTQSQNNTNQSQQQRAGGSGLNPIATATPSVVLEHPVLAATLTGQQQQSPRGVSAYRQIAPAPTSTSTILNRKH